MGGGDSGSTNSATTPAAVGIQIQTSIYGAAIQAVYGKTRIAGNLIWYGDFTSIAHTSHSGGGGGKGGGGGGGTDTTSYTYTAGVIIALGEGLLSVGRVWDGNTAYASIEAAGLGQMSGEIGQAVWGWLQSTNPSQALGYSGLAYAYAPALDLGSNTTVPSFNFEVSTSFMAVGSGDALPSVIAVDMLTNPRYGAGFAQALIGDTAAWQNYALAQGLLVSVAVTNQQAAADHLKYLLETSNTDVVWSGGVLKFVPLGDAAVSGNGVTYTPNVTPVYDLTEDHFLTANPEDDPLVIERKSSDDTFNCIKIEYTDRLDAYNLQIAEARDAADIDARGLRMKSTVEAHGLHDLASASTLATLQLQREMGVRNTYKFTLPWVFALLEPLDLVTVTDPYLGLYRVPVRINAITETDRGDFEVEAEDCPIGMASAPAYGGQAGRGFAHDFNVACGSVTTPVFFEPPVEKTLTGLEVWAAVSGSNPLWGGCTAWASLDGLTYKKVSRIAGGSRYGVTTTALAASGTSVGVSFGGKGGVMLPASGVDVANLVTLCWVGTSAGGEFFAHAGATLSTANAYTLDGLNRGAYTCPVVDHASGQQFVRVDDAIVKSDSLDLSMIGKQIHFKFTSFNVYGGGEQSLADVVDYVYVITGAMAKLPPPSVTGLNISIASNGMLAKWDVCPAPDYASTEVRAGTSWNSGVLVSNKASSTHLMQWATVGTLMMWAKHIDALGNYSAAAVSATFNVQAPNAPAFNRTDVQVNSVAIGWDDARTTNPIKSYAIWIGAATAAFSACTLYGKAGADSRSDIVIFRGAGAWKIWLQAEDVAGNLGAASGTVVNVTMPTNFILQNEYDENWSGTKTNAVVIGSSLYLPVPSQTWTEHFTSHSWATIGAQVGASYPLYFEPSASSGSYVEMHDIGKVIPSTTITVSTTSTNLVGSVGVVVQIESSTDGISWVAAPTGSTQVTASQVRYVRVTYSVTASGGDDLVRLDRVHVTVAASEQSEFATLALNAGDAAGTVYVCTKQWLDIVSVSVTAQGSSNIAKTNAIIDDSTSPAKVYVQAWDSSNNRTGGTVSLIMGGT